MYHLVNGFRKFIGKSLRKTVFRIASDQINTIVIFHFLFSFSVGFFAQFRVIYGRILDFSFLLESKQFLHYDEYQEAS